MSLISIILPVKDTAPYLPACLDSILNQKFTNWELIAINDHSSDKSLTILEDYARQDARVKVFTSPEPSLLVTLSFGYAQSKGELIHRMDSDDLMPDYKLEKMHEAWVKQGKGSVITGGTKYFSDHGPVGDGFLRYDKWLCEVARNNTHSAEIYRECVIPSNCWLLHRDDFERIGAFDHHIYPEDYDLCFRFYKGGLRIIGLDKVLHHWRDRPDRISRVWESHKDHRFFPIKIKYFFELERDASRPLVLWGAGKNGKDLAKLILEKENSLHWICNNERKIGKHIYDQKLCAVNHLSELESPQIIIAVASPSDQHDIQEMLNGFKMVIGQDYWFFS